MAQFPVLDGHDRANDDERCQYVAGIDANHERCDLPAAVALVVTRGTASDRLPLCEDHAPDDVLTAHYDRE